MGAQFLGEVGRTHDAEEAWDFGFLGVAFRVAGLVFRVERVGKRFPGTFMGKKSCVEGGVE
jgi:hypothetical protein